MRIHTQTRSQSHESGMVAIVVSMVIILVLSLIVLAFARISQREQRQALDRQLNSQAFYAAEAGINDARDALGRSSPIPGDDNDIFENEGDDCTPIMPPGYNRELDGNSVNYSCLLIDATPPSIEFGSISSGESKVLPVQAKNGGPIGQLSIYWEDAGNGRDFSGCPSAADDPLPPSWPADCSPGILRFDLVPWAGPINRANMINNTATVFAVPVRGGLPGGSVDFGSIAGFGNQGAKVAVGCTADSAVISPDYPRSCKLVVTGMGATRYFMRVTSLYRSSAVSLCFPGCGSTARETTRTQALVDSTGRAHDVLRRMQVRISLTDITGEDLYGPFPGYAIESGEELCKTFTIAPMVPALPSPPAGSTCGVNY